MEAKETSKQSPEAARPVVALTIGVDGRIYCHDLTPDLVHLVSAWCTPEGTWAQREAACQELERTHE